MRSSRICTIFLGIGLGIVSAFAEGPTSQSTKTYSYKGYSVSYPDSWSVDEHDDGTAAYLYDHSDGVTRATWSILLIIENPKHQTAQKLRDNFIVVASKKHQDFALKEKGSVTVAGKQAAFARFACSVDGHRCIERNIIVPVDDDHFVLCREWALENDWEKESANLDRITKSFSLSK
jgi:hypothetical protein